MDANQTRSNDLETLRKMRTNLSSGRWAVACVGMRGWMNNAAIGDGITTATRALVTRCETKEEAEALASRWNDAQPGVLPGSPSVFAYAACRYAKSDYIGSQNRGRGQNRDCDRRLA